MKKFDAVIIGFGKGGKTLATEFAKNGKKVAVIEKSSKMYGGTCINIACIPTKSLVHSADNRKYSSTSKEEFYTNAIHRKDELTSVLRDKNFHMLADQEHITVITGEATFLSDDKIQVKTAEEQFEVTAEQFFINTGASPVVPPIDGLEEANFIYNSTTLQALEQLPEKLIIIGGGYIGLEFASMYANFGSEVTVIDSNEEFLPNEDRDIAQEAKKVLEAKNIKIVPNSKVESVKNQDGGVVVTYKKGDTAREVYGNAVLLATGRKPNTENLGLENTSVEVNDRGAIVVDDSLKTKAKNIWALGDVNGGPQFTYISLDDFRIVKDQLFGEGSYTKKERTNIPYSVFIDPILSHVGLNERMAKEKEIEYKVLSMPAAGIPRARILEKTDGLLKALIDPKTNEILGCTLFCAESSEMINVVKVAMEAKLPYTFLRDTIFTHPTMSESLNDLFKG
ncbi:Pyruvate/2-oxoglutarate dehydrogenase complex, dihydrolipoamide dehydrogenase (E3) component [Psychrobacillus sp. OK028]|uniref:FAD-containing oxidoreductase n=1 Tax=Psychrobacillus sp. OK028 TaxID=1884359 RepID=UPI00087FC0C1|nr:FAD-containing oxidoreductase [Psychrobacillus sp. OK028]SDN70488.1 Pyruvate/2-oxoglutarate dehydrogenase complex, dihydrolipoamide dehydrogenase (E3) component [Psychrobacillus sp. OK028]